MSIETIPVPVLRLDADGTIVEVNQAVASLVGANRDELVGHSCHEALRPRLPTGEDLLVDGWPAAAHLSISHRIPDHEVIIRSPGGAEIDVSVDGAYERDDRGVLEGATVLLRSRHHGVRRPRSGIGIVAAVSHELRSPLTSVRGYTSLLLKQWGMVDEDHRKMMLEQIDRDARRISRMIGELLDISRLESGRLVLNRVELALAPLCARVVENVAMSYPDIEASVRFPPDFPTVYADSDKVQQVLTNLLENACKYASAKGIVVSGSVEDDQVEVAVCDTGPGIPVNDLAVLFRQFFRSKEGRPTGTGLGLWISRGLIEAHGGTLTATSGPDGSTFRFTLPLGAFEQLHPAH